MSTEPNDAASGGVPSAHVGDETAVALFEIATGMRRDAVLSEDGRYRYLLLRIWDQALPLLGWCCLNPSTADHLVDDPSLTRMIGFSREFGYGGLLLGNQFGLRATDPCELTYCADPIGPDNDHHLLSALAGLDVVCAWGASVPTYWRHRPAAVAAQLRERDARLHHLGLTKDGHPRHPLYLRGDTPLTLWEAS